MHSVRDSHFKDSKVVGNWTTVMLYATQKVFELIGDSAAVMSNNNTLDNVEPKVGVMVFTVTTIHDTLVRNATFDECGYELYLVKILH